MLVMVGVTERQKHAEEISAGQYFEAKTEDWKVRFLR